MTKQKLMEKKYYVELSEEDGDKLNTAYNLTSKALEYYRVAMQEYHNSDFKMDILITQIEAIEAILGSISSAAKSRKEVTFDPKKTAKNILEKIPFEIKKKEKEA